MTSMIKLNDVVIEARLRKVDMAKVKELAESIKEIGLINPIVLSADNKLLAGMHRYEAYKMLGMDEIPCLHMTADTLHQELIEIDENLVRADLHYIERGEHLARRKYIYEQLHPETKAGNAQGIGEKARHNPAVATDTPRFTADTTAKTGIAERTIRRDINIATSLPDKAKDVVIGRNVNQLDAEKLASMYKQDPVKAEKVVKIIEAQPKVNLEQAKAQVAMQAVQTALPKAPVEKDPLAPTQLYTIGYGGKDLDEFVQLLLDNQVTTLVDVRDSVTSHYKPAFEGSYLAKTVEAMGIRYVHLKVLGVPYVVRTPYINGYITTDAFRGWYHWNVKENSQDVYGALISLVQDGTVALMCAEQYALPCGEQAHTCHRAILADELQEDIAGQVVITHL